VLINIGLGIPTKGCGGGFIDNRPSRFMKSAVAFYGGKGGFLAF
jgi:hypothetical protein